MKKRKTQLVQFDVDSKQRKEKREKREKKEAGRQVQEQDQEQAGARRFRKEGRYEAKEKRPFLEWTRSPSEKYTIIDTNSKQWSPDPVVRFKLHKFKWQVVSAKLEWIQDQHVYECRNCFYNIKGQEEESCFYLNWIRCKAGGRVKDNESSRIRISYVLRQGEARLDLRMDSAEFRVIVETINPLDVLMDVALQQRQQHLLDVASPATQMMFWFRKGSSSETNKILQVGAEIPSGYQVSQAKCRVAQNESRSFAFPASVKSGWVEASLALQEGILSMMDTSIEFEMMMANGEKYKSQKSVICPQLLLDSGIKLVSLTLQAGSGMVDAEGKARVSFDLQAVPCSNWFISHITGFVTTRASKLGLPRVMEMEARHDSGVNIFQGKLHVGKCISSEWLSPIMFAYPEDEPFQVQWRILFKTSTKPTQVQTEIITAPSLFTLRQLFQGSFSGKLRVVSHREV